MKKSKISFDSSTQPKILNNEMTQEIRDSLRYCSKCKFRYISRCILTPSECRILELRENEDEQIG